MNQSKNVAASLVFGALVGAAGLTVAPLVGTAADAPKGPQLSRSISKEIADAQKALQASQYQEALKHLAAAEAVSPLTAFDKKTIDEQKGYAYIKTQDYKSAMKAYEEALATGAANAEETTRWNKTVFSLAANTQQNAKLIEYGKKMVDSDIANADTYLAITQTYFIEKDCKNAVAWADKSIAYARVQHETPKENLLLFKLQCASDNNDSAGSIAVLEDLVRLTGKTSHWNTLLRLQLQDEREDRNLRMIYEIMLNVGAMDKGAYYMEMAQLLGDAGLPGEAASVVEKGMSGGFIAADQKDRATRLLNSVKTRADTDRKGLVAFDSEANKNPAGDLDVKLGEDYYGYGDYQNAVTAITRGIGKGQIKHLDEAYVYLGLSQAGLKNMAEAKKAFAQLKSVPNISPRMLKLWTLYSDRLG